MSDSEGEGYEKQVKIVLVGDGSSGKVERENPPFLFWIVTFVFFRHRSPNDFPKVHLIVIIIKLLESIIISNELI